jgi:cobalt-zinc-cadmium efflux system protein
LRLYTLEPQPVKIAPEVPVHLHEHHAGRVVKIALIATLALVVAEFTAGILAHSLALIGDGWHNLADIPALAFSWLALYLESKPPDHRKSFGYQRAGVLAAFVNAIVLLGVAGFICVDGYRRILHPQPVHSLAMVWVGFAALLINGGVSLGLMRDREDLNLRSVFVHYLGDALSDAAVIAGGFLIHSTGQRLIDPLLALLIAGMILWSAVGILGESGNILLESLPKGMTVDDVARTILRVPGVREVHDVHVWSLGSNSHALSCHVHILDMPTSESEHISHEICKAVEREFGIAHTTVQFEHTHEPGDFHRYMPEPARSERK